MAISKTIVTVLLPLLLLSCANNNNKRSIIYENYIAQNKLQSVDKITTFHYQGWNSLDNRHLIVSSNHKKHYLLTLDSYCVDLDFSHSIIIKQSMSHRLSVFFDSIVIPKNHNSTCRIKAIHVISKEQKNELTALRKKQLKSSN
ncbi:MAG TPA: hypothetical protein ENJ41_03315 [Oceanospirillales bacterium]|nr:hypothetical protein [Oceanospirillales bacterium]